MIIAPSISEAQILASLRTFLLSVLSPPAIEVIRAQGNRVPEPKTPDFVVMTPILRERIETNIDKDIDAKFTASISGTVMTVSAVVIGAIALNAVLLGANITPGTSIVSFGTGAGGTGTYNLSNAQTVAAQTIAAGYTSVLQSVKVMIQLDIHGPASAENAQIVSTLLRDEFAVSAFAAYGPDVTPLHASDPRQAPFVNAEDQYENRWVVDAYLQANIAIPAWGQAFADSVTVSPVDASAFPA